MLALSHSAQTASPPPPLPQHLAALLHAKVYFFFFNVPVGETNLQIIILKMNQHHNLIIQHAMRGSSLNYNRIEYNILQANLVIFFKVSSY